MTGIAHQVVLAVRFARGVANGPPLAVHLKRAIGAPLRKDTIDPMAATTIEPGPNAGERPAGKAAKAAAADSPPTVPVSVRRFWRAVVRTGGPVSAMRERDRVEWHLRDCAVPQSEGAHCTEGQHLMETIGHPDGHCIIDGVCGLCGQPAPSADASEPETQSALKS